MAKKPKETKTEYPYPGSERFGDWTLDNIVPAEPGETLVNDDPDDPNKFAHHGETRKPTKK